MLLPCYAAIALILLYADTFRCHTLIGAVPLRCAAYVDFTRRRRVGCEARIRQHMMARALHAIVNITIARAARRVLFDVCRCASYEARYYL